MVLLGSLSDFSHTLHKCQVPCVPQMRAPVILAPAVLKKYAFLILTIQNCTKRDICMVSALAHLTGESYNVSAIDVLHEYDSPLLIFCFFFRLF